MLLLLLLLLLHQSECLDHYSADSQMDLLSPIRSFLSNVRTFCSLLFFSPRVVATLATIFGSVKRRITGSNSMMQVVCFLGKSYRQVHLILLVENGIRNLDLEIAILWERFGLSLHYVWAGAPAKLLAERYINCVSVFSDLMFLWVWFSCLLPDVHEWKNFIWSPLVW